jgi:PAS domain S-box-containing protein
MISNDNNIEALLAELEETRRQLYEAQETIEAVRTGQVDALVVQNGDTHQLYTLKTADHPYRVFIEKMTEGAVTLDPGGLILYANPQFAALVQHPASGIIGLSFEQFVAQGYHDAYRAMLTTSAAGECKGELLLTRATGTTPVLLSIAALELEQGPSLSVIVTDLTSQKNNERELQESNRQLEQLNKTLEASNNDLQQFASVASHDLQEPLRKIQMFANLVKTQTKGKLEGEENDYLNKIMRSASRMKVLIVDVLNYSRLSAKENEFIDTDLNLIVRELLEDFELIIQEKNATIICDPMPVIQANPGQIRQVLQNLISNALKFSKPHEPPIIRIEVARLARKSFDSPGKEDGPYCIIKIVDNGIGFDEKYIPNIFSLFERLHSKDQYEGSGIGLAVTKKIIEKHNGLINVQSTAGKGATFSVIFPCKQC